MDSRMDEGREPIPDSVCGGSVELHGLVAPSLARPLELTCQLENTCSL